MTTPLEKRVNKNAVGATTLHDGRRPYWHDVRSRPHTPVKAQPHGTWLGQPEPAHMKSIRARHCKTTSHQPDRHCCGQWDISIYSTRTRSSHIHTCMGRAHQFVHSLTRTDQVNKVIDRLSGRYHVRWTRTLNVDDTRSLITKSVPNAKHVPQNGRDGSIWGHVLNHWLHST